jgi:hypothetical protein
MAKISSGREKPLAIKILAVALIIVVILVAVFVTMKVSENIYQGIYDNRVDEVISDYGIDPDSLDEETKQKLIDIYLEGGDDAVVRQFIETID